MMQRIWAIATCASLATALAGATLLASSPARAFDDRPSAIGPFSSIVGIIGGGSDEDTQIDFRERPPLVVPKNHDLPPPRPSAETRAANWPQDQEVVRRRDEQARARQPQQIEYNKNPAMDKRALMAGRSDEQPVAVDLCDQYKNGIPDCEGTSMDKLKRVFSLGDNNKDVVVVGKEPDRQYLTEPPKGYRRATQAVRATRERPEERPDYGDPKKYFRDEAKRDSDYR